MDWNAHWIEFFIATLSGVASGLVLARLVGSRAPVSIANSQISTTTTSIRTQHDQRVTINVQAAATRQRPGGDGDESWLQAAVLAVLVAPVLLSPIFHQMSVALLLACVFLAALTVSAWTWLLAYRVRITVVTVAYLLASLVGIAAGGYAAVSLRRQPEVEFELLNLHGEVLYALLGWTLALALVLLSAWAQLCVIAEAALALDAGLAGLWRFVSVRTVPAKTAVPLVALGAGLVYLLSSGLAVAWITDASQLTTSQMN